MDVFLIIGIIGTVASVICLIIAIVQYMKYKETKDNLKKLKNVRNTQIWGSISLILEAYKTLDEAKELITTKTVDSEVAMRIVSARKSIVAQYLRLLEQAILEEEYFFNSFVIRDLNIFKSICTIIIANRFDADLDDVREKVYTRDLFSIN
jgi:Ni,Fe-hydrogenase I large subunit